MHRTEGIIWDAVPILEAKSTSPGKIRTTPVKGPAVAIPRQNSIARTLTTPIKAGLQPGLAATSNGRPDLMPDEQGVQRGVRLSIYLADAANRGEAVGISYALFVAYLHAMSDFRSLVGRNYLPSDSEAVIHVAWSITSAASGPEADRSAGLRDSSGNGYIHLERKTTVRPARRGVARPHV